MTLLDHIVAVLVFIAYPTYSFLSYRKEKLRLIANEPGIRLRAYKETVGWLWLLCLIGVGSWLYQDRLMPGLGLTFSASMSAWIGVALTMVLTFLMGSHIRTLVGSGEKRKKLREEIKDQPAVECVPRTLQELRWFFIVSVTAGVCEEVLFRGFLLWYLQGFVSLWPAVAISCLVFGVAHSYQGASGGLRTGIIGLVLALSYVLTGTLWIAIFLHAVGDMYFGLMAWLVFRDDASESHAELSSDGAPSIVGMPGAK